jgi:Txe/YoeB family toxin of Txe-Axe toxin-antitoxin module
VSWQVVFAKHAEKDAKKLVAAGLKSKAQELLALLANEPLQNPPHFEKFMGDLTGLLVVSCGTEGFIAKSRA